MSVYSVHYYEHCSGGYGGCALSAGRCASGGYCSDWCEGACGVLAVPQRQRGPNAACLRQQIRPERKRAAYRREMEVSAEMVAGTLPRRSGYPENTLLVEPS